MQMTQPRKQSVAEVQKDVGPLQALVDLVPSNIFSALQDNGNMLQVIFFFIIWFGTCSNSQEKSNQ